MHSAKKKNRPTQALNRDQKAAVKECNRPVLVLAGAGSGKTSVISLKISYLVEEKGIDPNRIAAITFTNKATKELRNRLEKMLQNTAYLAKEYNVTFYFCRSSGEPKHGSCLSSSVFLFIH